MMRLRPLLIAALVVPMLAAPALACSCGRAPSRAAHDARASAIFSGRVVAARPGFARIRVTRTLKGDARGTVSVTTAESGTACGISFTAGEMKTNLHVTGSRGRYQTSTCLNWYLGRANDPSGRRAIASRGRARA